MGRTPLPDDQRRSDGLRIRLNRPERDSVTQAAAVAGQEPSVWARAAILAEAARALRGGRRKAKRARGKG